MIEIKVKNTKNEIENIQSYCLHLSKKNNSILYLLESYLNKKLLDDPQLTEIRDIILTVSADISKLPNNISLDFGDKNERLF